MGRARSELKRLRLAAPVAVAMALSAAAVTLGDGSEHAFSEAGDGSWHGTSAERGLQVRIQHDGSAELSTYPPRARAWTFGVRGSAVGRAGASRVLGRPVLAGTGALVGLERPGASEWFACDSGHLVHGFEIEEPPGGGPVLRVELAVEGGAPVAEFGGRSLALAPRTGRREVRLDRLTARDSESRSLPAFFAVRAGRIVIGVRDGDAVYPIRIQHRIARGDWVVSSGVKLAHLGYSVGGAGDIDGDGYDDIVAGAPDHTDEKGAVGAVFVFRGSPDGPLYTPAWKAAGNHPGSQLGYSVALAGDVNGDGWDDLVAGAPGQDAGGPEASGDREHAAKHGQVRVYFGSAAGVSEGGAWTASGDAPGAWFGFCVAGRGDVNADGYADILASSYGYDARIFAAYLYFGSEKGPSSTADWEARGEDPDGSFGHSVAFAGDADGDGHDDVLVSEPRYSARAGRTHFYRGGPSGPSQAADRVLVHDGVGEECGYIARPAGDADADGYADVVVASACWGPPAASRGRIYLHRGSSEGPSPDPDWTADGPRDGAMFGLDACGAGDLNADGRGDILASALMDLPQTGRVWIHSGLARGAASWLLATKDGGEAGARFGWSLAPAGDVDGDGIDDAVIGATHCELDGATPQEGAVFLLPGRRSAIFWERIAGREPAALGGSVGVARYDGADRYADVFAGAPLAGGAEEGRVDVYSGSPSGPSQPPVWSASGTRAGGRFGTGIACGIDVTSDGFRDLLVGAPGPGAGGDSAGEAFLFIGGTGGLSRTPFWTGRGKDGGELFGSAVACTGDLDGDGYEDVAIGAPGADGESGRVCFYRGARAGLAVGPAWAARGEEPGGRFGHSVAGVGDVNGDGHPDVVVGAPGSGGGSGEAFLLMGTSRGPGDGPVRIRSPAVEGLLFGYSVARAGDVDDDGLHDVLIGAPARGDGSPGGLTGAVWLFLGAEGGLAREPAWTASCRGPAMGFGHSLAIAGDLDGDRYPDLVVGASPPWEPGSQQGHVALYIGSGSGFSSQPVWTSDGERDGTAMGYAVAGGGDIDGDGLADVVIGAPSYPRGGAVFLAPAWALVTPRRASIPERPEPQWTATGRRSRSQFGSSVAAAGDVNGDGFSDLVVGTRSPDDEEESAGAAFLYLGGAEGLREPSGWTFRPEQRGAGYGYAVGPAGDVNADGFDDVLVGAPFYRTPEPSAGRAFVYLGAAVGPSRDPDWTLDGDAARDQLGWSVAPAGDIDGDGYPEILIGAVARDGPVPDCGGVVVAFGGPRGPERRVVLESAQTGALFGHSVAPAGDVNRDGFADVLVGAPFHDLAIGDEGQVSLYLGGASALALRPAWTAGGDAPGVLFGYCVAGVGDVNRDGYSDALVGAPRNSRGAPDCGSVVLFLGGPSGLSKEPAWQKNGAGSGTRFGWSLAPAGDLDRDGYLDVVIGGPYRPAGTSFRGEAHVFLGARNGLAAEPVLILSSPQLDDRFGWSVAGAGDTDGDGAREIIIGAPLAAGAASGDGAVFAYSAAALGLARVASSEDAREE